MSGEARADEYEEPCGCGMWICRQCRPENFDSGRHSRHLTPEQEAILRERIEQLRREAEYRRDNRAASFDVEEERAALSAALTEINELRERQAQVDELVEATRGALALIEYATYENAAEYRSLTRALAPFEGEGER